MFACDEAIRGANARPGLGDDYAPVGFGVDETIPAGLVAGQVDFMADRRDRGLDFWTGKPLTGETLWQWLRLRFGLDPVNAPKMDSTGLPWGATVEEIVLVDPVALRATVIRTDGELFTMALPPEQEEEEEDDEEECESTHRVPPQVAPVIRQGNPIGRVSRGEAMAC